MSHEMNERDGLVLVGQPAWHGLGIVVPQTMEPRRAMEMAGLGWEAKEEPLYLMGGEPTGAKALYRSDTRDILGIHKEGYKPFQNSELADLASRVAIASNGKAEIETFGSIKGGSTVYCLLRTGSFEIGFGDRTETYALLSTSHDGSRAVRVEGTSVRVVCKNTLDMATGTKAAFRASHTQGLDSKIEVFLEGLSAVQSAADEVHEFAVRLADKPLTTTQKVDFFRACYLSAFPEAKDNERGNRKAQRTISDWVGRSENPGYLKFGTQGTLWAAFNSVTEWSDHARTVKGGERVASNLFGTSRDFKRKVLSVASESV